MSEAQMKDFSQVARVIGTHRFLFGTDGASVRKVFSIYRDKFGFTSREFDDVIYKNGYRFMENVLLPIKKELLNSYLSEEEPQSFIKLRDIVGGEKKTFYRFVRAPLYFSSLDLAAILSNWQVSRNACGYCTHSPRG